MTAIRLNCPRAARDELQTEKCRGTSGRTARKRDGTRWAVLLAVALGCANEPRGPDTVVVTGKVTRAGAPVAEAIVNFQPVQPHGSEAQAYTDAAGAFDVSVYLPNREMKRGMVPGQYLVSVRKLETPSGESTLQAPRNVLPEKYASPTTSGLEVTVAPGGPNDFTLNVDQ